MVLTFNDFNLGFQNQLTVLTININKIVGIMKRYKYEMLRQFLLEFVAQ